MASLSCLFLLVSLSAAWLLLQLCRRETNIADITNVTNTEVVVSHITNTPAQSKRTRLAVAYFPSRLPLSLFCDVPVFMIPIRRHGFRTARASSH